jgi:hypothetical protein
MAQCKVTGVLMEEREDNISNNNGILTEQLRWAG